MTVTVGVETPLQDDVRELVALLNAHLLPLSPIEFQFKMTVEQMAGADTTVFVARNEDGVALGIGALKLHPEAVGEVKRMYTREAVRGERVGSQLLAAIIERARAEGVKRLVLETGEGPGFAGAQRLYERRGFTRCGAFLDYPESQWSAFYEMNLAGDVAA
ncbi:N-acetyltransferase [Arsenicitalea aurantiaca]|uniref:N-acetyltransferase n=1 Tax=Arsenicitalea aurantiaca TaxID=1783274 RepID=A0A433XFQ2_9HYPH|nr:GNAT family N-acetyltransferase [Arsenicitalea aurantiaca]RUT32929.1 N-acetyltransferase [Arsenicitalea aurantiaca]